MNAIVKQVPASVPTLKMNEDELIEVLQSSVYPGAKLPSIKMVIGVCKASGKDPLKKPYHIVPMQVSTGQKDGQGWDIKEWRDVIMPGINDYRTDAARTGQHAGTSEPEFGPDITDTLDGVQITYPKWCRVTVKRQIPSGQIVEFSAVELWVENYAPKSNKSTAPNAMWRKRPYAQLAKCAEAQALRKGFPEVGSQPTADEMEGKEIDMGAAEVMAMQRIAETKSLPLYPAEEFAANLYKWRAAVVAGKVTAEQIIARSSSKYILTEEQKAEIRGQPEPSMVENIKASLLNAQDTDTLDVAADLIGDVDSLADRAELSRIYHDRRAAFAG